jgi:two-component system, OmpR family, sensor histidine kinase VanS
MIITTLIIYLATYFLMPHYYYVYKQDHLQSQVQDLVQQVNGLDAARASDIMDQFALQNNLKLIVRNDQGVVLYPDLPSTKAIWLHSPQSGPAGNLVIQSRNSIYSLNPANISGVLTMSHDLTLSGMPPLRLTVIAPFQPISEASHVLLLFLPYMFLIALVISVTGSVIYSMVVTRPLLNLNSIAKRMAHLDFTTVPALTRKDEIGELSVSLNALAVNLQQML